VNPQAWGLAARIGAAVLAGGTLSLAFPPAGAGWVAFGALIPLMLAVRSGRARDGALAGLIFGVVFFGILLFWISLFGFLAWGALSVAHGLYLAAFGGLAAAVSSRWGRPGRLLGWPLLWAGLEMMRARFPLGGFTWGDVGYSQVGDGTALPVARIGGVYLLGLVVVAVAVLLAEVLARGGGEVALAGTALVLAVGPVFLPLGLAGPQTGSYDLVAVQGNVARDRFTGIGRGPEAGEDGGIVADHLGLTATLVGEDAPDLIVWPENAFDRDPLLNEDLFAQVRSLLAQIGSPMVLPAILEAGDHWTNSNLLLTPDGTITARYDKVHLVPFGEYVPLGFARAIVPVLDQEIPVDGMAGDRVVPFEASGARVGTLICFESTYPRIARALVRRGTDLLVVTTNNASYGTSPASAQHLAMSRMRAVEHGRAVVQAAISGISAFILPDGSTEQPTGLFEQALLRGELPLTRGQTPYTRHGSAIEIVMGIGAALTAAAAFARRKALA